MSTRKGTSLRCCNTWNRLTCIACRRLYTPMDSILQARHRKRPLTTGKTTSLSRIPRWRSSTQSLLACIGFLVDVAVPGQASKPLDLSVLRGEPELAGKDQLEMDVRRFAAMADRTMCRLTALLKVVKAHWIFKRDDVMFCISAIRPTHNLCLVVGPCAARAPGPPWPPIDDDACRVRFSSSHLSHTPLHEHL